MTAPTARISIEFGAPRPILWNRVAAASVLKKKKPKKIVIGCSTGLKKCGCHCLIKDPIPVKAGNQTTMIGGDEY